jgi:PAS domain S-box-containing protein
MPENVDRREEQYQLLVTYVREYAIFSTDAHGIIRSWNEGVRTVFGYGAEEFVGQPSACVFTPEDVASGVPERELAQAAESGAATDDRWLRRSTGERFWASGITTAIRDESGRLIGFTKVLRDLTDRKMSEESLRASEERLQLAATAARLGTWDYDPGSNAFVLDPRCRELLGVKSGAVDLDGLLSRIAPANRAETTAEFARAIQPGQGHFDLELRTIADDPCWLRITGRAYFDGARAVRVVGTAQDVTERKRAELARDALFDLERAARAEAERANRLKDEFLSTLSHELRTPLNAILGYTRLLRAGHVDGDARHHALQVIERNALAQTRLIEDILDISRMMRGGLRLDAMPTDLGAVVDEAVDIVAPATTAKRLDLTWTPPSTPAIVLGDADRLRQVVTNLISNATKFTPPGGSIALSLERRDDELVLSVRDTGIGIARDFLPNVFERFRQADARRARAVGGLGLGLSIVRQLVELHGGSVEAASPGPGQGATFTVRLPAMNAEPQPAVDRPPQDRQPTAAVRLDGLRILVVDDDPDAVELMRLVLEKRGAQVNVATSAERALNQLSQIQPHLLISDLGMPDVDGLELIHQVRERNISVPAIAVTAYARTDDATRARDAGYDAHVSKPVEWDELMARVVALSPPPSQR